MSLVHVEWPKFMNLFRDNIKWIFISILFISTYGFSKPLGQFEKIHKWDNNIDSLYVKCKNGNSVSCVDLGFLYEKGQGVKADQSEAVKYYKKSCLGNNARGCYNLGVMYHFGKGVKIDYPRSAELYRQACNGQYVWGCSNLGAMYAKGLGVEESRVKAKNIFSLACGLGDDIACTNYKILANE